MDKQLGHFKKQARRIAERTLAGGSDEHLFKPTHVLEANLQCVGIEGKHPAVGFNVYLTEHTQQQVTKALILLGRTMSQDKVDRILSKTCTIPKKLVPFTYKGKSGWDSRLASYTGSLDPPDCDQSSHATVPAHVEVRRVMHVVQCPDCHKQSPSQLYKFQYKDLDVKVKCCECLRLSPLKIWKCNCGVMWHTCKVHTCAENVEPTLKSKTLSKSSIEKTGSEKTSSKRLLCNAPFEEILDDDLRIEAKRARKSYEQDKTLVGYVHLLHLSCTNIL